MALKQPRAYHLSKMYDNETVDSLRKLHPDYEIRPGTEDEDFHGIDIVKKSPTGQVTKIDTKYPGTTGGRPYFEAWKICHDPDYEADEITVFTKTGKMMTFDRDKLKTALLNVQPSWRQGRTATRIACDGKTELPNLLFYPSSYEAFALMNGVAINNNNLNSYR